MMIKVQNKARILRKLLQPKKKTLQGRKNLIQHRKLIKKLEKFVKEKEMDNEIKCEECNLKVNSEKHLEFHKLKTHQTRCKNVEKMIKI